MAKRPRGSRLSSTRAPTAPSWEALSRRTFLKLAGASAAAGPALSWLSGCADPSDARRDSTTPVDFLLVQRATDLLSLRVGFVDLEREGDTLLVTGDAPRIVVEFPRQHILEEAVDLLSVEDSGHPSPPLKALVSGTSRVVFRIPDELDEIPYSLTDVLSVLPACALEVARNALPPVLPPPPLLINALQAPGLQAGGTRVLMPDMQARTGLSPALAE